MDLFNPKTQLEIAKNWDKCRNTLQLPIFLANKINNIWESARDNSFLLTRVEASNQILNLLNNHFSNKKIIKVKHTNSLVKVLTEALNNNSQAIKLNQKELTYSINGQTFVVLLEKPKHPGVIGVGVSELKNTNKDLIEYLPKKVYLKIFD